ncbi:MAG: hypothetical protein UY26_C0003G0125 [Candidatus Jorgensenbacteria bacterium GW2011_GWA1_48_13]|uniref:Uncharacterized protein n=1 Tax=Candidatus Jorgensenbacteria bacterium GW2011_GWB1_50_10 TaxID=1618665 RepID=A0A0G1YJD0_9BACT|nr:MAG: hypothetical protein UY26_C0003G0125 [Candidatus Jorgensenbacteria bacterium GW2011_GWA1_48_13]KKW15082.1 MAG: hypothetical protein UY55_C0002G0140 [Candidatus Jorgensenbacteria bacterium GW2011_GWB1_50_10]
MSEDKLVVPGNQAVDLICASGKFGRRLLGEIANPAAQRLTRHPRIFSKSDNEFRTGEVLLHGKRWAQVTLTTRKPQEPQGKLRVLIIEDKPGSGLSLKPVSNGNGILTLQVDGAHCLRRLQSFVNQLVCVFIVHGHGWQDREGREYFEPYGAEPRNNGHKHRERKRRNPRHQRYIHPLTDG